MTDTALQCPHCNQHIEIPDALLGQTIECPSCKSRLTIPMPTREAATHSCHSSPPPLRGQGQVAGDLPRKWHLVNGLLALRDAVVLLLASFVILILPTLFLGRTRAGALYVLISTKFTIPVMVFCFGYMAVRAARRTVAKYDVQEAQSKAAVCLSKGFHFVNIIIAFVFGLIVPGALGLAIAVAAATVIPSLSQGGVGLYIILYLPLTLLSVVACGLVVSKRTQKYISKEAKQ